MNLLSRLYGATQGLFHKLHDAGLLSSRRASIPVVCVGNLTAGGTGKSILVDWLVRQLKERRPGVACRGYRAGHDGKNDEMKVLQRQHPELTVIANKERWKAVQELARQGCGVAILDDGFQHRRLQRDCDIVILDATDPFSHDYLPGGRRREPVAGLNRADLICLSHANRVTAEECEDLRQQVEKLAACPVLAARHVMGAPEDSQGNILPPQPVHLLAGVGSPRHVMAGLRELGYDPIETTLPGDHRPPSRADRQRLAATKLPVVCTLKDAVKEAAGSYWVIPVEWAFMDSEDVLKRLLAERLG